ncbi:Hypothetical predicted protein [Pelobates cultripes]|uniref:Uncharacterized protein n=1 Tax=Pelobates cultripes TaxID=61616 RepID=A0AAD1VL79_PELCU|nr:Hypothetical predicted protein [Pelobates cultripes]
MAIVEEWRADGSTSDEDDWHDMPGTESHYVKEYVVKHSPRRKGGLKIANTDKDVFIETQGLPLFDPWAV